MAIRESLQTNTLTFGDLFANGRQYRVPAFQRNYSWGKSEWEDLWADVITAEEKNHDHYLGAVVLQRSGDSDHYEVIDGQQRLATLSILTMAVLAEFEDWAASGTDPAENRERSELLRERLISPKDPQSLKRQSRLRLNRTDDAFYQSALVNGVAPANVRRLQSSEKALWKAWLFFRNRVAERYSEKQDGKALAHLIQNVVSRRLLFIEIVVDDENAAYTVFETLNSRGVALGTADLLKNYLFAKAASGGGADLAEMHRQWDRLVQTVPLEKVADLIHHHANTRALNVSKRHVFRRIRETVTSKAEAFKYVAGLSAAAEWYAALLDPYDQTWSGSAEARKWVRVLAILRAEQYRPLALVAAPLFQDRPADLANLLRILAVITLRANVVLRLNTGDIYRAWNRTAVEISQEGATTPAQVARRAAAIYGEDEAFRAAFVDLQIPARGPRKKLVRYLIAELESDASGRSVDWDSDLFTVEHIIPESPEEGWEHLADRDLERFTSRLGNYLPLEAPLNRKVGRSPFPEKLAAYSESRYALPKRLEDEHWGPESVQRQARKYARRAAHIWRIDF